MILLSIFCLFILFMSLGCCFFLGGGYPEVLREMNFEKMPEKGRKKSSS